MGKWESALPGDSSASTHASKRARIALVGFAPLLRELLIPALSARAELRFADSFEGLSEPCDAVLIARPDPLESEHVRAIHERLRAQRIVQVTPRGDHAVLYEIWPRRARLGELDSERLVEILCAPAPDWSRWNPNGSPVVPDWSPEMDGER